MKTRSLGRSLSVAEVGYGCMGLSGTYGSADEAAAVATIHAAVDAGVTLFDTADAYGPYTNEVLVGRALKGLRHHVLIATKFGQRFMPDGSRTICGRPEYVREACDASLKRLGVDYIDLYYQHRVDKEVPIDETVDAMAMLAKAGKVRFLGLSEASVDNIRRAYRTSPITAVQSELSLWSRQDEADVLPVCRELGIGYVAYSPLGRGFLTGTVESAAQLEANDVRRLFPRFADANIEKNRRIAQKLSEFAAGRGITAAQLALAWVLKKGADIVPIPGTRSIERIKENVAAADIELSDGDMRELEEIAPADAAAGERYGAPMMAHIDR